MIMNLPTVRPNSKAYLRLSLGSTNLNVPANSIFCCFISQFVGKELEFYESEMGIYETLGYF
jgi:hypothetical protein